MIFKNKKEIDNIIIIPARGGSKGVKHKNLRKVKIIDCSWHMPLTQRDGYNEYLEEHIPEAIFFDIDKNSEPNTNLPHMLPKASYFQKIVSELGINNEDKIVIYDNSDVFSACRCWFSFFYFVFNCCVYNILSSINICFYRLHWIILSCRHLFKCSCMNYIINS